MYLKKLIVRNINTEFYVSWKLFILFKIKKKVKKILKY